MEKKKKQNKKEVSPRSFRPSRWQPLSYVRIPLNAARVVAGTGINNNIIINILVAVRRPRVTLPASSRDSRSLLEYYNISFFLFFLVAMKSVNAEYSICLFF